MESSAKKTVSLISYDPEKVEAEEPRPKNKKPLPGFLIWETRTKSVLAFMSVTHNLLNMLQFSGAVMMYGGVVWVSYFISAVIVGVPMITAEIALGHYINNEIKYVWRMCPVGKGIFWNCLLSTFAIATLCHVYLTVLLHLSFGPIQTLDSDLRNRMKQTCYPVSKNQSYGIVNVKENDNYRQQEGSHSLLWDSLNFNGTCLLLPKNQLWLSSLYLAAICFIMVLINCKGIQSLQKVTVLFVLIPYLCSVILAMLILTLPGAVSFIGQSWHLDWHKLKDFSVWLVSFKAMVRGFLIGGLGLIFVSVHSDHKDDIMVDVVILFINVTLAILLFTITVLGLLGVLDTKPRMPLEAFEFHDHMSILMNMIKGLSELPPPKWLWKFLFYSYLIAFAFSQLTFMVASVADVVISLVPKFKTNKFYVITGLCIVFFLLGVWICSAEDLTVPIFDSTFVTIGFLQSITLFWIYNYERVCTDFHFLMGYKPSLFYQFTWVITPIMFLAVIISAIILQKHNNILIHNNLYLPMLHIFIYVLCAIIEGFIQWRKRKSVNIFRPDKAWGPTDPLLQKSRIIFKSRIITKEHIYRQKLYEEQLVKPADLTAQDIVQLL